MLYLLCNIIGVIFGSIATILVVNFGCGSGVLKIDHSNPEKDVYRFCIDDFENLNNKKKIVVKIDHHADLSQE